MTMTAVKLQIWCLFQNLFLFSFFFWRYVPNSWQSSSSKIDKSLTLNDRYISYLTNRKSFKVGLSPSKKFGFICVNESPLKISFFMASQTGTQTITMNILPDISKRKGNQTMKFGQSIEYNVRNIFLRKSYRKWNRETSSRPFFGF